MIATLAPPSPLDQWRRRFDGRRRRTEPRPIASMGCLTDGPVVDNLIEIEKLTLVLLYDDTIRSGHCALRLAGYSGSRVPRGVRFGGQAGCRFVKDLALQPVPRGRGYRIDRADEELLRLALMLNRQLDRDARFGREMRNRPFLPNLWAGFHKADAATITGDGPELAAYSLLSSGVKSSAPVSTFQSQIPTLASPRQTQSRFILSQRFLRPLAISDVNQGMDCAARSALRVPQRSTVAEQVAGCAIVENEIELKIPHAGTTGGSLGGQFVESQLASIPEGPEVPRLGFRGADSETSAPVAAATVRLPRDYPSCGERRGHGRR